MTASQNNGGPVTSGEVNSKNGRPGELIMEASVVADVADVTAETDAHTGSEGPGKAVVGTRGDAHGGVAEADPAGPVATKIHVAAGPVGKPLRLLFRGKRQ